MQCLALIMCCVLYAGSEVMIEGTAESCLPVKCDFMCMLASSAVIDMFDRLFSGMLKIKEVEAMYDKKDQVLELCTADQQRHIDDVRGTLELRNTECTAFSHHKLRLGAFCRQLRNSGLQVEGR